MSRNTQKKIRKLDLYWWVSVITYLAGYSMIGMVIGFYLGSGILEAFVIPYVTIGLPLIIVGTLAYVFVDKQKRKCKLELMKLSPLMNSKVF